MELTLPVRPSSNARPTQQYYVPRKLLENGRGPQPRVDDLDMKENMNDGKRSNQSSPREKSPRSPTNESLLDKNQNRTNERSSKDTPKNNRKSSQRNQTSPNGGRGRRSPKSGGFSEPDVQIATKNQTQRQNSSKKNDSPKEKRINQIGANKVAPIEINRPMTMSQPRVLGNPTVRNPFELKKETDNLCICNRTDTHVHCKRCGYECAGRVMRTCSQHKMKMFLTDIRECPNQLCRSIQIEERDKE